MMNTKMQLPQFTPGCTAKQEKKLNRPGMALLVHTDVRAGCASDCALISPARRQIIPDCQDCPAFMPKSDPPLIVD